MEVIPPIYFALVKPHLKCCIQVLGPQHRKDIDLLGTTALFRVELDLRSSFIQQHMLLSRLGARKIDHSCSSAGSDATMRRAKLESSTFQLSMPSRDQVNSRLKPKLSQDTKPSLEKRRKGQREVSKARTGLDMRQV
ncbi:hypothetical protein BTVI_106403 [Pitangus sulphuratus]|nr:hypothetical protein BTVI_106403 [Pitangus sulphuratus]